MASADTGSVRDPDDVEMLLDIAVASHGHGREEGRLKHVVRTYERWRPRHLHGCDTAFAFHFRWDGEVRRAARVYVKDGRLAAEMLEITSGDPKVVGEIRVWRSNRRDVRVSFPTDMLEPDLEAYEWDVLSSSRSRRGCIPGLYRGIDNTPDKGWLTHDLSR